MGGRAKKATFACSLSVIACAFGAVVPSSFAAEFVEVPAKIEAVHWIPNPLKTKTVEPKRTFRLSVSSGYCYGEPPPSIDQIKVVERSKTAERPFKSAIITVFLLRPAHQEDVEPIPPNSNIVRACSGLGIGWRPRIKLKRPVHGLTLYDGSYTPPRRIWPPVGW